VELSGFILVNVLTPQGSDSPTCRSD